MLRKSLFLALKVSVWEGFLNVLNGLVAVKKTILETQIQLSNNLMTSIRLNTMCISHLK